MRTIKTVMVLCAFFLSPTLNAQDNILLKNGEEISVCINEKTDTEIKYKIIELREHIKINNQSMICFAEHSSSYTRRVNLVLFYDCSLAVPIFFSYFRLEEK